ncbi:putative MFS allantoate transporter [Thozetella sp. PMI_491]|nr:putative MFS allantoate transporter [Thozetella sp. PMI_491]
MADSNNLEHASSTKAQMESFEKVEDGVPKYPKSGDGGDVALQLVHTLAEPFEPFTPEEERKVMRKVDRMILPYLAVCYIFFFVDKTTLSYAAIFGLNQDLNLQSNDYSWLSSLFYWGFFVFALPTNLLLQRFPLAKYLGANIFLWGFLLMAQAAVNNFAGLAVLRVLGGAAEACADPAFMIITSMWYTRQEQPLKIGLWYTAVGIGIAFGGILGYGIGNIHGALASWKYEFLIIGALCSAWGIVMIIFLPDNPVTCRWLTDREKRIVIERLRQNQTGIENKTLKVYQIREAFTDYKSYLLFMCTLLQAIVNGGTTNFGTLIIKGFQFSTLNTTLLQIPYGALIFFAILICVFLNHGLSGNNRCWFIILFLLPNVAGAFGLHFVPEEQRIGRLVCYYLTGSINAPFVMLLSLQTANTAGHTKKVTVSAILFLGYCVGNIAGPFFYKTEQAPTYSLGIWSMITSHFLEIAVVLIMRFALQWENRRRDREYGPVDGSNQGDLNATAFEDLTDRENKNFRYVY